MVIYADHYLLDWEREHKAINERWRTAARNGQSLVPFVILHGTMN